MAREGGSDFEPGLVARIARGVRTAIASRPGPTAPSLGAQAGARVNPGLGANDPGWFGPLEPLTPVAPPAVAGRRFDYPSGYNIAFPPREYEPIAFRQLRGLADAYDLLRLVIETRKDQVARMSWTVAPRDAQSARLPDPRAGAIIDFLAYPDREHAWDAWLRMLLEDLLVIDAPTIYPRLDRAGRLFALEPVDGATIKRVIDDWGRMPAPPAPAYQQILKGLPAVDYAADELIYLPRNARTNRVYGYSPVEQVVMTVNIALRRQLHQLQYYTEGTVPEALIGVPETWTPDQIGQFQAYWDALLEDNTAQRRRARFVPATISKSFVQTKEAALKDDYDEWLARIVCYAFSVSSQWAVKQMNRATAETAAEQAADEGLAPLLAWVQGMMDRLLRQCFGAPDLCFRWQIEADDDTLAQAQADQIYLQSGAKTINEVRAGQGLAPLEGGDAALILAGNALVPLASVMGAKAPALAPAPLGKYSPDEPRVPAGNPTGGQWTTGGASAGDAGDDDAAEGGGGDGEDSDEGSGLDLAGLFGGDDSDGEDGDGDDGGDGNGNGGGDGGDGGDDAGFAPNAPTADHLIAGGAPGSIFDDAHALRVADGGATQIDAPLVVAQEEEEEEPPKSPEELFDPMAEVRSEQFYAALNQLREIDPNNPNLEYAAPPGWVPTNDDIAQINQAIYAASVARVTNFVMPGGILIGTRGDGLSVRSLPGGLDAATQAYSYLSVGGTPYQREYPGSAVNLPGNAGLVGLRSVSASGPPTIDINVTGLLRLKLKYLGE